jgi:DNA-directed RNA polymerase specialized sigma24 family protein
MDGVKERYDAYFPRLFAYVHSCVGSDMQTQDIVIQAFSRAFCRAGTSDEQKFQATLFRAARRLCRQSLKSGRSDDKESLSPREREIISLVFDASLTRRQIANLFGIRETTVGSALMTGLRKLNKQTSPAAAAAYLKLA